MNICVRCKHIEPNHAAKRTGSMSFCNRPKPGVPVRLNPVTGDVIAPLPDTCRDERRSFSHDPTRDRCGPEGKYFELPPEPKWYQDRLVQDGFRALMAILTAIGVAAIIIYS